MTRSEAFAEVINQRGVYHKLGMDDGYVRSLRKKFKDGDVISEELMKDVLLKYGATIKQEELWVL